MEVFQTIWSSRTPSKNIYWGGPTTVLCEWKPGEIEWLASTTDVYGAATLLAGSHQVGLSIEYSLFIDYLKIIALSKSSGR